MSIKPPSDIVLDVARAADPVRSSEAAERLARLSPGTDLASDGFSKVLGDLPVPIDKAASLRTQMEINSAQRASKMEAVDPQTKVYRNFEAMVLQNLVENMLPDNEEFFGEGTAGMIWKSMLTEQLGADLAKKLDLGIGPKHTYKPHRMTAHVVAPTASETNIVDMLPKQRS